MNITMKKGLIVTASTMALFLGVNHIASAEQIHTTSSEMELTQIAERFATNIDEIKALNNLDDSVTSIATGTKVVVPDHDIVEVLSGDTLTNIANKHEISLDDLFKLNPQITETIHPGQLIAISEAGSKHLYNDDKASWGTPDTLQQPTDESDSQILTPNYPQNDVAQPTQFSNYQSWNNDVNSNYSNAYQYDANHYYSGQQSIGRSGGTNYYDNGQCTSYAFDRRSQLGKPVSNLWGNANQWANAARQSGYEVNHTPEVGAIMQSTSGPNGHVGVVEHKNTDGSIVVSEMNWQGVGQKSYRTIQQPSAYNYIH